jgi:hypothetical protein
MLAREPRAVLDFLKSVTERKDKQVATDPRRFTVVQPPPFAPQVLEAKRGKRGNDGPLASLAIEGCLIGNNPIAKLLYEH